MNNELNRYYIKIRTSLEIDPKIIHEELWDSVLHHRWAKRFRQRREDVSDHLRSVCVHYPNLEVKILIWFDKLSAMIHIQLMRKL